MFNNDLRDPIESRLIDARNTEKPNYREKFGGWGEGKRERSAPPKGKRESSEDQKEKREKAGKVFCDPIPIGNQTARTNARTHGTTRNNFPVGLTPQPPIFIVFVTDRPPFETRLSPRSIGKAMGHRRRQLSSYS